MNRNISNTIEPQISEDDADFPFADPDFMRGVIRLQRKLPAPVFAFRCSQNTDFWKLRHN
jgi:hypothetical protein